ncbi:MAG: hypothetical protein UX91_C0002G0045 [Candidatus Amesbacteria bacterium GW2011_GWB1_47_19]|nr:MAG: hypothetical protein UW51_C0004G0045 [Candidatus Amesbacteria bacterium GW2011_GWA1_44_24]KKU31720.1 MAG: glycosyl transferase family protein [Candidatus Amesbacteria bacterium GW2011_GWC1_46_24]KKU67633.1 MAG: hypothetical protein UX91_C0002G0045 [Candidatus Amesbacteria bacterium GW2011_GWB1_47_19]OGD06483.1 MAG: hypothetical protein A2379_02475 [Candidatus Amesbacteria bacterium RIFOXYB1_FULL_47_13]HBC72886.1 hypothetical protein [Candidatus Amesbacteria bacterium]
MTAPLVSVVLASYNNAGLISESIRSILNQTYSNFEVIIADDGSDDDSQSIINKFASAYPRIKTILSKQNEGISNNRNKAIRKATGTYIAIVDSDDICLPTRLSEQVKYLENHANVGVLGTKWYVFTDNPDNFVKGNLSINDINAGKVPVHNPTTMIRKQIFDNYGLFDSRIRYCEDVELYYRWYSQGVVFRNLNRYLTKYRVAHGNNTGENINALLYWQLFKLNMMAITKYKIRFSLSGYLFTLKLFLYCLYRSLRLNHIYSVTRDI